MIKDCFYREKEFEIVFEWPLPREMIKSNKAIGSFMGKIKSLPGTRVIQKEEEITGVVFSYEGWEQMLGVFSFNGRKTQLAQEFNNFFSKVKQV